MNDTAEKCFICDQGARTSPGDYLQSEAYIIFPENKKAHFECYFNLLKETHKERGGK